MTIEEKTLFCPAASSQHQAAGVDLGTGGPGTAEGAAREEAGGEAKPGFQLVEKIFNGDLGKAVHMVCLAAGGPGASS